MFVTFGTKQLRADEGQRWLRAGSSQFLGSEEGNRVGLVGKSPPASARATVQSTDLPHKHPAAPLRAHSLTLPLEQTAGRQICSRFTPLLSGIRPRWLHALQKRLKQSSEERSHRIRASRQQSRTRGKPLHLREAWFIITGLGQHRVPTAVPDSEQQTSY